MPEMRNEEEPSAWFGRVIVDSRRLMRDRLGIDKAIAFTVLGRGCAGLAGLGTVAFISHFLSPAQQGYYYTFGSLIGLQVIFELGFSWVILQMASHERAHLTISSGGQLSGDEIAHDRLASILQKTVKWYTSLGGVFFCCLLIAGFHFFSDHHDAVYAVSWRGPWIAVVIAATCTFLVDPWLSFMEGCGYIAEVARVRVIYLVIGSVLGWVALATHHGLYAPAGAIGGYAIVSAYWLFFRQRHFLLPLLKHRSHKNRVHWMNEVWPFQWRIAVTWLSGYFIFQLYNPVLFRYRGAIEAGQMGMSLTLANALTAIAISWINTKAAPFGAMIARKEFERLDQSFFRAGKQAFGISILIAAGVWISDITLVWRHSPLAHRILQPFPLAILLIFTCLNIPVFAEATYLRAHKQEKFLVPSIAGAILIALSTYFLGRTYGATGIVLGTLFVCVFAMLPLGTWTFFKYRKRWHTPEA
jgi:O-antigen/teichoic acid export membrane protein